MEIDAISEESTATYTFYDLDESVCWNGRDIQKLETENSPAIFRTQSSKIGPCSLRHRQIHVKPNMSRPPNESEASIEAGYDEERGPYIERKWTWTWKDKDEKEASSDNNQGTTASDPPDSGDRDFDKK